jgi:hypothetical protein
MGRSPYFKYEKIEVLADTSDEITKILNSLKNGDKFTIDLAEDNTLKLTRHPSCYDKTPIVIDSKIIYVVKDTNIEPGLEQLKNIRCIYFEPVDMTSDETVLSVITTDGALREREHLEIENNIMSIRLVH